MSGADKQKIERVRAMINESTLTDEQKEGLQELLDRAAVASNGTADKVGAIAETLALLCAQWARHVIAANEAVAAAVAAHARECPLKGGPGGKVGIALQFARSWPLMMAVAAACFSPHLPRILEAIKEWIR